MEYMEAKRSYTEAKAKQRALHKRVQTLQQKNQPMHDFKKHLETWLKCINEQRDDVAKKFKSMKTKWDENEKLVTLLSVRLEFSPIGCITQEARAEEISNSLSNLKKEEKNRAKKIQESERAVQNLQADLAKPIPVEDMSEIDEEIVCFLLFQTAPFRPWDSVASIKATTARKIASLISRNSSADSLRMNRELKPK